MGPRSHERGNKRARPMCALIAQLLQWGRVLTNAETRRRRRDHHHDALRASMGPRSHERGNALGHGGDGGVRSFNGAAFSRTRKHARGCWCSTRLSYRFNGAAFSRTRKQPGRAALATPRTTSFNGAAFSRTRKLRHKTAVGSVRVLLQWGRVLTNAETSKAPRMFSWLPRLQWGRVLTNAETAP